MASSRETKTSREDTTKQEIPLEDALMTEICLSQALIDILVSKGVFTHEELLEKVKEIRLNSNLVLAGPSTRE